MNVNTYDATPMLEETISGTFKGRVFNDQFLDVGDLWFELSPGKFGLGESRAEAREWYSEHPGRLVSEDYLRRFYPEGFFV